jgi:hypothetical protein
MVILIISFAFAARIASAWINHISIVLGDLVVIMFAIGHKVHGFKRPRAMNFKANKNP